MPSDRDLLIRLDERTEKIAEAIKEIKESIKDYPVTRQLLKNHLSGHRRTSSMIWGAATAIATIIAAIINGLLNGFR